MKQYFTLLLMVISILPTMADGEANEPMVREDRVWEYRGDYFLPGEHGIVYHLMRFNGGMEVNGHEYHCFELFKSTFYESVVHEDGYSYEFSREENRDYPKFLLREEPGKVYILTEVFNAGKGTYEDIVQINDDEKLNAIQGNSGGSEYREFLLYDFTKAEGEIHPLPNWLAVDQDYELDRYNCFLIYDDPVTIDDNDCRARHFKISEENEFKPEWSNHKLASYGIQIIESIGVTYNGCLPYFSPFEYLGMMYDSSKLPYRESRLEKVYDAGGNVIFNRTENSEVGVKVTTEIKPNNSDEIYDIMGRRIDRALPGSVYIRDGKKFVGR